MNRFLFYTLSIALLSLASCKETSKISMDESLKEVQMNDLNSELQLSESQERKIQKINENIGLRFKAIGEDPSLSGFQKGQKKRELALEHKNHIFDVLTEEQKAKWVSVYGDAISIKNSITDKMDDQLNQLKEAYKTEKEEVENSDLNEVEKKQRKEELEARYKSMKGKLKENKDKVKDTPLLNGR